MKPLAFKVNGKEATVDMTHGGGGKAMARLINGLFRKHLDNELLAQGHDATVLPELTGRVVVSTDGHVISPLFFPGGDIGSLAVHGTVNDVAMSGARPLYLTVSFILEEGFPLPDLDRIVASMAKAASEAGVKVVSGDTKVVEKGKGDGVFISTTGIGVLEEGIHIAGHLAKPGQAILLSGTMGDHGVAILSRRENLGFETQIESDTAALNGLVAALLEKSRAISVLRDPTRGGLAATLNEIAMESSVGMELDEAAIPVNGQVQAACELLGLDPLYIANEGKLICICDEEVAEGLLAVMRAHPNGCDAARVGLVTEDPHAIVRMTTRFGGQRVVDWIAGEQLPRIC